MINNEENRTPIQNILDLFISWIQANNPHSNTATLKVTSRKPGFRIYLKIRDYIRKQRLSTRLRNHSGTTPRI